MSEIHKCAECGNVTEDKGYKVQDSFYGLQYLCSQDCVDIYEGWWCDTCLLLHDHDTTMESDNSCQKENKKPETYLVTFEITSETDPTEWDWNTMLDLNVNESLYVHSVGQISRNNQKESK